MGLRRIWAMRRAGRGIAERLRHLAALLFCRGRYAGGNKRREMESAMNSEARHDMRATQKK